MEIREVRPEDCDVLLDLGSRGFGVMTEAYRRSAAPALEADIRDGRVLGVYDGPRLAGAAKFHLMRQWWNGSPVPMGGVAGVSVAPEDRGRGVGSALTAALIEAMAGRGLALSALYPATTPVYRRAGYEHAGAQHWVAFRADALRVLAGEPDGDDVRVRRAGPDDVDEVAETIASVHRIARDCGPISRESRFVRRWLDDSQLFTYLADDGFLAYRWNSGNDEFVVERLAAGSAATARRLWAIVGSGSSIADRVRACVAPYDPVFWLLRDRSPEDVRRIPWMLRIVDAPAAIAARGFPAGLDVNIVLAVTDALRPGNSGVWRLSVGHRRGLLEKAGGDPAARLNANGFAALYAGAPAGVLRRAGLLECESDDAIAVLDSAFSASPFMLDYF